MFGVVQKIFAFSNQNQQRLDLKLSLGPNEQ